MGMETVITTGCCAEDIVRAPFRSDVAVSLPFLSPPHAGAWPSVRVIMGTAPLESTCLLL